jgi:hypothetical protein
MSGNGTPTTGCGSPPRNTPRIVPASSGVMTSVHVFGTGRPLARSPDGAAVLNRGTSGSATGWSRAQPETTATVARTRTQARTGSR